MRACCRYIEGHDLATLGRRIQAHSIPGGLEGGSCGVEAGGQKGAAGGPHTLPWVGSDSHSASGELLATPHAAGLLQDHPCQRPKNSTQDVRHPYAESRLTHSKNIFVPAPH